MDAGPAATADGLDKAPIAQVLATLEVRQDAGLTAEEAASRLAKYGPNGLPEHHESLARKVLHSFVGPMPFMIEAAAVVSAILRHWPDFFIIAGLLLFNAVL